MMHGQKTLSFAAIGFDAVAIFR